MTTSKIAVRSNPDTMAPPLLNSWALLCTLLGLMVASVPAANLHWDANGTTAGAGATPTGTWGTDNFWSTSSLGTNVPGAWTSGETAVFSAGGDATSVFTVTLSLVQNANGLTFEEGTVTLTGADLTLAAPGAVVSANTGIIDSVVTGSAGVTKFGNGEVVLKQANTFTGNLTNRAGTLTLENNQAAGSGLIALNPSAPLFLRGTVDVTLANNISLLASASIGLTAEATRTMTLSGVISGSRGFDAGGQGTLVLAGVSPNTFTGPLAISQGTVVVAKDGALGSIANGTTVNSGGTLAFDDDVDYLTTELITVSGTGVGGLGAIRSLTGDNDFSGSVALTTDVTVGVDSGSLLTLVGAVTGGSQSLTKVGPGILDLISSGNTYLNTLVTGGTLGVWGGTADAGTGLVTVSAGARLEGTGNAPGGVNLSGAIAPAGTFEPGASPGVLTSGSQTWNGGGSYEWQVADFAGDYDQLDVTGSLTVNSTMGSPFTVQVISLEPLFYDPGDADNFDNTAETDRTIVSTTAGISGFDPAKFVINTNDFSNDQGGGRFVILTSGNNLVLRFDPPPVITVCSNLTQANDVGTCSASVSFAAVATDNQPGVILTYATNGMPVVSGTTFALGTTAVDVTATDSVGNTDTCSFAVTVTDAEAPVVVTKPFTNSFTGALVTIFPTNVDNGSYDLCGIATPVSVSPNVLGCFELGDTVVTLTVVDSAGNTNTGLATVTLTDGRVYPPTVVYVDDDYATSNTCDLVSFPAGGPGATNFIGYNAFASIQAAVDAVAVGGTVNVAAGTYSERVVVTKAGLTVQGAGIASIVTGTTSAPGSGVTPSVFKVAATGVTISDFKMLVDFAYNHSAVHSSGTCSGLTVSGNTIITTLPSGAPYAYGLRNAIAVNPSITVVGYTHDNVGYSGVSVLGNTIEGTFISPTTNSYFRAGIQMDLCGGVIAGNTSTTINHDFITRFANQGDIMVSGNTFLGGGANIGSFNGGAGTVTITNNVFDNSVMQAATGSLPTGASLRLIYYAEVPSATSQVMVVGNTFTNHRWAVSAENFKNVTFDDNAFTPKAGATDFVHISFNTKIAASTSAGAINMFPVGATLTRNIFNGSGSPGGIALAFYNHRNTGAVFGSFVVGTTGNENEFSADLSQFIELDASSGPSTGWTRFGGYGSIPATTMAPWPANIDAQNNKFDVGSGMTLSSAMPLSDLFAVEDRIQHKLDIGTLGFARVKSAEVFVTTASGSIQRGIDAASTGDTVSVTNGTFTENIALNKQVAVVGAGSSVGGTVIATAAGPSASGLVQVSASGSSGSPVQLKNIRLTPAGRSGISVGLFLASAGVTVDYLALDNVQVIGSNLTPCTEQERGLYVDYTSSLLNLTVTNCAFDNLHYGWYFQKAVSADTSTVKFVTVHATSFSHNNTKAIYAEKLSDAVFTCSTVASNGYDGGLLSGCAFFQPWMAGFDINLKAGTYANLTFQDCTFEDNALGGAVNGVALALKGRGTGTDSGYFAFPATLSNVVVMGCLFDGNERSIQLGEPGKANTTPTGVLIANSSLAPAATGVALRNEMAASVAVVATNNWWGDLTGPTVASNAGGSGAQILGGTTVDYSPWLGALINLGSSCGGFQPDPLTAILYSPAALAFAVEPVGAALGAPLATQPVVNVLNEISQVATQFNGTVTVTLGNNPGSGVLTGTTSVTAVAGVATFTNLAVTIGGGEGFTLVATAQAPIVSTNSATFDIENPSPTLATLNPAGAVTGSGGGSTNVLLTGSGYVPTSVVLVDNSPVPTTFGSASTLTATLSTAVPGGYSVVVSNPPPVSGSATSGALTFTVSGTPTVVYVDDDYTPASSGGHIWGFDAFVTIPGGITAVTNGGTVIVEPGTYAALTVNKPVTLLGADSASACGGTNSLIDAGLSGTAITIAANDVTVKGFGLKGATGLNNTGFTGLVVQNNLVEAGAYGVSLLGVNGGFTLKDNCITVTATEIGMPASTNATIGVLLGSISGSGTQLISGNNLSGPLYGYLLADVDAASPLSIQGGTVYGAMQGVAVINYNLSFVQQNSTFVVDGVNMSGFSGTSLDLSRNFHAGVYVFTGGSSPAATVVGTVTNVTVAGTGKISGDSAGLSFADFSTGVGARQNITVVNCTIEDNLNRGVNARGSNAVVAVTGSTLEDNGFDPYGLGGNDGFGLIARNRAQVTVSESVIINPAAQTNYTVTALAADADTVPEGPTLTVSNSAIENNGNLAGKLAQRSAGTFNASGNWWGETNDVTIASLVTGAVDFTPYLASGVDGSVDAGFQGDFSALHVTAQGAQTSGLIQEGLTTVSSGGTVSVEAGTYAGSITVSQPLTLQSTAGAAATTITGDSTTAVSIAADSVTIRGFTVSNPAGKRGIYNSNRSNLTIAENRVVNIGTSDATASGTNIGIGIESTSATMNNLQIVSNVISNLAGGSFKSCDGIFVGSSTGSYDITGLLIASNRISQITSSIAAFPSGGRGAYGILLNHASGVGPNTGQTVSPQIVANEISGLEGLWAHAIGLEGNTPNALVTGSLISGIIDHKSPADPDAVGVMVEQNLSASTVTITGNSFSNVWLGVRNVTGLPVSASGNWWGSATGPTTLANPGGAGVVVSTNVDFSPWLADGTDTDLVAVGFQPNNALLNYTPAYLVFNVQPGNANLGALLSPQPVVQVMNENSVVASQYQGPVTVALGVNPGGGLLAGTLTANAVNGVATFLDLMVTNGGGVGYTLIASSTSPIVSTNSDPFSVTNPLPSIATLAPYWKPVGSADFNLTVTGSDFVPGATVIWGGSPRTTTFVSANSVQAAILAADVASVGTVQVKVNNPVPGGGDTAELTFTIKPVVPDVVYVDDGYIGLLADTLVNWPYTATGTNIIGYDAFATIQAAVNAVATSGTVHVAAGSYDEDVTVTKTLSLLGAGAGSSIVTGPIGGSGSTFRLDASNVLLDGFTITRAGNNLADWNNPGLNTAGVAIQGLSFTGNIIRNCLITGMRTAIDINNSNGHTVRNNVITDNRTGLILRNQTDNLIVVQNKITLNWTVGVLFLDASGGSNVPVQTAANGSFGNNDISGNWYGQIVDRQSGGSLPAPGSNLKDFSGDWLGTATPVVTTNNSAEPGYAAQIPVAFGGTATPPGGQPDICGPASANIDYTPWLHVGTDTDVSTGFGTYGFQGDYSKLHVDDSSAQVGTTGRIQEGVDLLADGALVGGSREVLVEPGSYQGAAGLFGLTLNKSLKLIGTGGAAVTTFNSTAMYMVYGTVGDLTVQGLTVTDPTYDPGIWGGDGSGIWIGGAGVSNVHITECVVQDLGKRSYGINLGPEGAVEVDQCTVSGVLGYPTLIGGVNDYADVATGIFVWGWGPFAGTVSVHDNVVSNLGPQIAGDGIRLTFQIQNGSVANNQITLDAGHRSGISLGASLGSGLMTLTSNVVVGASQGLRLQSPSAQAAFANTLASTTGIAVLNGSATILTNSAVAGSVGLLVSGDTTLAFVQGNTLTGNTLAGIKVNDAATVDAGDLLGRDITSLGTSAGGNDLSGYGFDEGAPWAIDASASTAAGQVLAYSDDFGAAVNQDINRLITDGFDVVGRIVVEFSQAGVLTATAPTDVTVECAGDIPVAATNLAGYLAQGGVVSASPVTISSMDANYVGFPVGDGMVTRTYTLTDADSRTTNIVQTITVDDVTPPTITGPAPVLATNDLNQCHASGVVLGTPLIGDNCGVASLVSNAPAQFPVGATIVTWTVTDNSGLTNSSQQTVTVLDLQPPAATAGTIASCYQTQSAAEAAAIAAVTGVTDNCGLASTNVVSTVGTCSAVITVRVTDVHGNYTDVFYNTRIDNEAPTLGVIGATQFAANVMNANTVLQGVVNISVVAGENCGLVNGHPAIELVNGSSTNYAVCVATNGPGPNSYEYLYEWTVLNSTSNGLWTATVSASDLCETTNTTFTLNVNKTQITGQLALEDFAGTSRTVVFKATTNSPSVTNVVATWTISLAFTNGTYPNTYATYTLSGVPNDVTGLSAKTDWNLRRRLSLTLDLDGQAVANFTGASELLGGDITQSGASANAVQTLDYLQLLTHYQTLNPLSDIDGNGQVDGDDYNLLLGNWFDVGDPQ
jgi:autotransporter-associated beta strand protein